MIKNVFCSIAFLEKLGFEERRPEEGRGPNEEPPEELFLEKYRSPQARGRVLNYLKRIREKYR